MESVSDDVVRLFNSGDSAGLFALFGPDMQRAVPLGKLRAVREALFQAKGRIVGSEPVESKGPRAVYRLKAERGEWTMRLSVDPSGAINGLLFQEPPAAPPPVAKSTLPLGLPFRGQWFVHWGGDRAELNHHVGFPSQRRAADLVQVDASGSSHRGDGKQNTDYFAYGQEILAVADGRVVTVIDGVPENVPGEMNEYIATGNMVVIEHAGGVWSVYAHLQPDKIRVKRGAKVKRGDVIGLCGNSGNSSEPHLHFQLQDGPLFEKSWGVEPVFSGVMVTRDGKAEKVSDYTWLKGDRVGEH